MPETTKTELQKSLLKDLRVPRYTSYPTAPHFKESVDSLAVANWYKNLHKHAQNISLYVHIPFCEKLCLFCGCHMKAINSYTPVQQYLETIEEEVKLISGLLENCPPVKHLHFGGGSPTALSGEDFIAFMGVLKKYFPFSVDTDIAVEIDPRTVDDVKIDAYTRAGMNRMSIGVQDFNEKVQVAVNRVQSFDLVKNVIDSLVSRGVSSINMDIMYGLPYQTIDTLVETMEQVLSLNPDRLAVFGYAHVPWMKKHQNLIPEETLANLDERWEMYSYIKDVLCAKGYQAIGLDHFAKNTDPMAIAYREKNLNRNFQGYTTDTADALIGIGHSSIGWCDTGYMQNLSDPIQYKNKLDVGLLPIKRGRVVTDEDRVYRRVIECIMCYMQVDLDMVQAEFNSTIDFSTELKALEEMQHSGMVALNGNVITIPESGRIGMRLIASVFDKYLSAGQLKHSSAV